MLLKRKYLFGTTILAGVIATAAPALAQETQLPGVDVQGDAEVDTIVVTGSRIRRDPTNAPTPLIQVKREQLLETGLSTVIDYLATIPALSNSLVPSDTTGSGLNDGGLSFANLRSLGSGRTLTLVDGRRHVGSSAGSLAVDVDTIPRLLIENIEIVTGGASSVYGADAVSGVVNYVLRKDFEGLEVDANVAQINQDGQMARRLSILGGTNLFDDRLNVYGYAEYEKQDEVRGRDIDWLSDGRIVLGIDADPSATPSDGFIDNALFYDARRLDRPVWGSTTLANMQRPSMTSDPDVPYGDCTGATVNSSNCFAVDPAYTWWFVGTTARLANFGQRIGNTGLSRPYNIGGDGPNANTYFSTDTRVPESESFRYQVGANFRLTNDIMASVEAKYITEDTYDASQPTFFDIFIANVTGATSPGIILNSTNFTTRVDNAFIPANLQAAIASNTFTRYAAPTANAPGAVIGTVAAPFADHRGFGSPRFQENNRELWRYVVAFDGNLDSVFFLKNVNWDFGYTYGDMHNTNVENGWDSVRFGHAMDAVVDTAGLVNGRPGEIVCRVQLIRAQGLAVAEQNPNTARTTYGTGAAITDPEVVDCVPLNVFGEGNQTEDALNFVNAHITVRETNIQENAIASFAGELWDFWGAGSIGVAVGAEWRREYTEGVGRSRDTNNRYLLLNTGPDFLGAEYESNEYFAELSIPLLRDSWLGEYAELSGSYRQFDYTTAGEGDVYGVNLVYRPIQDITFKTSFNTSFRAPNLAENFRPQTQTFANGFVDPCDTRVIANFAGDDAAAVRANRAANCATLAAAKGLTFNFTDPLSPTAYLPTYSSGIAGVNGGNPFLKPETSESFTFSTVLQPRFIPNLSLILDYYEIRIEDVIAAVTAQVAANRCVSGSGLDTAACATIFRNNPTTGDPFDNFKVGAPAGNAIGGFIQGSVNYAALETRGLDFTVRYLLDTEEMWGVNWGRFSYDLGGLWLIDQKSFSDVSNPSFFTEASTGLFYPRVRMTSRLSWAPNDTWTFTWVADWQTSQDISKLRDVVATGNLDSQPVEWYSTGNFVRNDFSVRWNVSDELTVRAGVTNAFDAEQKPWLGSTLYSNFDPYGRRFNIGLNYRPW